MNSYKALSDIITTGENGIIVKDKDIKGFSNDLLLLMNDGKRRQQIALKAIENSKCFMIDKIAVYWVELFNELKGR